jgi:phosphoglycolate phosphatase-like HAD superfamily hydrolase
MFRLITDFDGPIMDVSERYYRVYRFCLETTRYPDQPVKELTKSQFWELKRSQVPEKQIAFLSGLDETQAQAFHQLRHQTVHTEPYFQYDTLIPEAIAALIKAQQAGVDLVVMTMRRVRELGYAFAKYSSLNEIFPPNRRYCLSNDYVKTGDIQDKPLLMARAMTELPQVASTWMVGDTEADITAAKTHGIYVVAVESGIRDRTQLEIYQPNLIVKDLTSTIDLLLSSSPSVKSC